MHLFSYLLLLGQVPRSLAKLCVRLPPPAQPPGPGSGPQSCFLLISLPPWGFCLGSSASLSWLKQGREKPLEPSLNGGPVWVSCFPRCKNSRTDVTDALRQKISLELISNINVGPGGGVHRVLGWKTFCFLSLKGERSLGFPFWAGCMGPQRSWGLRVEEGAAKASIPPPFPLRPARGREMSNGRSAPEPTHTGTRSGDTV